jgi:hypothetical protein
VRVNHVEVTLVDRDIDRFANRSPGMVQRRRHISQFDEVLEVFDSRVAPSPVEIEHEGAAVSRHKHGILAADLHVARRVAGMLSILGLGRRLDDRAAHASRKAHRYAVDFGAALLQNIERFGHIAEFDPDFLEDGIGVILDQLQAFLVEHLEIGNLARDVRCAGDNRFLGAASIASAATASAPGRSFCFSHGKLLLLSFRNCLIK